jgi:hypothetical protein
MASTLSQVLAEIQAKVDTRVTGVRYRLGAKYVEERTALPRVVWVPGVDPFGPAQGKSLSVRSVCTRRAQVLAHVLADDLEQAELLVNAVVWAAHSVAHGSLTLDTAAWFSPGWLERGEGCVLTMAFALPVVAPELTTATIGTVGFDNTATVTGDGALDCGESS